MVEFGDVITLENEKEYVVASTCIYKNQFYSYLVNIKNSEDCILGVIKDDNLKLIQDAEIFIEVMPQILDNVDLSIFEKGVEDE